MILGCYWAPGHQRAADIDYMHRLQPPAIRILDPDPNQMTIAYSAAPNALLLPRDWALSEQHDDVLRDPIATGVRHARDWREKIDRWRAQGAKLPPDSQIFVVGINEPKVWEMREQVVIYTVAMLDECTKLGVHCCALNLSVGWPANNGPNQPPDWEPYAAVEPAIQRGNHVLVLHEYWYRSGPQDNWGWWAGRLKHCPWDVPIIVGETGIDMYVDMPRWEADGKPNRGWRGNVDADTYANQMREYARAIDTRVIAILPFLTDYRSNNWESFDTLEAHDELLSQASAMVPQAKPPTTGPGPTPPDPKPPITPPSGGACVHPLPGARITQHMYQRPEHYERFGLVGHNGTDFGIAAGVAVRSCAAGIVAFVGDDPDYGLYCRVKLEGLGAYAFYAHLSRIDVAAGQVVTAGQTIGLVGSTGNSTGPHLHFEIRLHNEDGTYATGCMPKGRVDPETWAILHGLAL